MFSSPVDFISAAFSNPALAIVSILTLGVIMVNGWTDAPNAIATCVSTRSLSPRWAILMAAFCEFLGIVVMTSLLPSVAMTITNMVDFGTNYNDALIALCAALFAIVLWATAASWLGIPTSESHALIAGLTGAAIAINSGLGGINGAEWTKVLYGLGFSLIIGFALGFGTVRLIELLFKRSNRLKSDRFFKGAQIAGAASMAFMHGAQDGQKFMGVFLLGSYFAQGLSPAASFNIPMWLMILCSIVMATGVSIGGMRIIKTVGMDMVHLEKYQGFSADLAAAGCLLFSSVTGMPVSTTHTKTTSIMGVGAAKRLSSLNWGIVKEMVTAWVLTFPGCGLLAFVMVKLFLWIF